MRLFETFTIKDLNPTGGIFVNHNPNKLKNAKLGPNITTLDKTLGGSPNDMIQIYRGTPDKNSQIAAGDYISTNKQLAKDWAGTGFVIGLKVKKGDILDDITEPGGEEYIYIPNAYKKVSNKLKNESKTMKLNKLKNESKTMKLSELRQIIKEGVRRVINENNLLLEKTSTKIIKINFNIDWNKEIGKVEDEFTLAFSPNSTGVFSLGNDIEKFSGLSLKDAQKYKETPSDAYVYGLCNTMNGGADIFFWTNGMRLSGAAQQNGVWPAVIEQISHECVHLTRLILTRAIAKKKRADIAKGEWITFNYGSGEYFWPAVGENEDKKNPIVIIDEEAFATSVGLVAQTVTPHFLEMASIYIPTLSN